MTHTRLSLEIFIILKDGRFDGTIPWNQTLIERITATKTKFKQNKINSKPYENKKESSDFTVFSLFGRAVFSYNKKMIPLILQCKPRKPFLGGETLPDDA